MQPSRALLLHSLDNAQPASPGECSPEWLYRQVCCFSSAPDMPPIAALPCGTNANVLLQNDCHDKVRDAHRRPLQSHRLHVGERLAS